MNSYQEQDVGNSGCLGQKKKYTVSCGSFSVHQGHMGRGASPMRGHHQRGCHRRAAGSGMGVQSKQDLETWLQCNVLLNASPKWLYHRHQRPQNAATTQHNNDILFVSSTEWHSWRLRRDLMKTCWQLRVLVLRAVHRYIIGCKFRGGKTDVAIWGL